MNNIKRLEETGMTRRQLVELCGIDVTERFLQWMRGQTVGLINKTEVYYYCDIKRFLRSLR